MSYLRAAFGGFEPQQDVDAAVKLSINAILMDSRLEDLANVLTDDHEVGGIEGDPGWIIERRDLTSPTHASFYSTWPAWAVFRAYVDISVYELAYPEFLWIDLPSIATYAQV